MTLCVSPHWMITTCAVDYGSFIPLHDALCAHMFLCVYASQSAHYVCLFSVCIHMFCSG